MIVNPVTEGAEISHLDEIIAKQKQLEEDIKLAMKEESESAKLAERATVLAKMKADVKLYGFKTSDFKGILLTRTKRGSKVIKDPSVPSVPTQRRQSKLKKAL